MKKYLLEIVVFVSGAVVMILEIVGSRVLAPYLGTSSIVWTSLIGIVLGSLSFGYWWGGRLADKGANYKQLSGILFGAAVAIVFVAVYKTPVLVFLEKTIGNLYVSSVLATITLFAVPSVLLGTVSPYAIKLKLLDIASSGRTAGNLSAISTLGSIVGTFLAGFFLLALIGTTNILFVLSFLLLFASQVLYAKRNVRLPVTLIIAIALVGNIWLYTHQSIASRTVDVDTAYNRVMVMDALDRVTKRPMRLLITNPKETQSGIYLDNPSELAFEYSKFYRLGDFFKPNISSALMLGGAGYSYPKDFLRKHPSSTLDVVEIDPGMTAIAKKYFFLDNDPKLTIYHEDARNYLNKNNKQYDIIYGDAFRSFHALPYQLTTLEAAKKIYSSLSADGVYIVNLIGTIEGNTGKFIRAEYATYKEVFPHVYMYPVHDSSNGTLIQNIMLVAFKSKTEPVLTSDIQEYKNYLSKRTTVDVADDVPLLTDDFAPVDNYIAYLAKQ